jgi:hypothetical protein
MEQNRRLPAITELRLTVEDFPAFYHSLLALRFPVDVAELLELRFLINHAVDDFKPQGETLEDRQFRDALRNAIDSFGVHNKRHRERLTKILTMFRDLHTAHLVGSCVTELKLRSALTAVRDARTRTIRQGLCSLAATIFAVLVWLGSSDPGWSIKLLTLILAYMTWDSFHSLPALDRQPSALISELNEVMRRRLVSVNWKRLIHKLALVLGYKQIPGIIVFRGATLAAVSA